jgi:carboxypeptidase T
MKYFFILIMILISFFSYAQNYKQISITITNPNDILTIAQTGVDIEDATFSKYNVLTLFVSDDELDKISSAGISYNILIDDWNQYYNSLHKLTAQEKESFMQDSKIDYSVDGFGYGSMGGYYTFAEIVANLDSMYAQYPNLITPKFSIGSSQQSRTIWAAKISDNPNVNENEPAVGFDALVHAREPQSMATMMYYMWYLLQNYDTSPAIKYLVDNREIYFVPCFNPDGYEYNRTTNPNGGGMWRKNRRNNGDGSYGVDLNRNFGYQWGYDNSGSSPIPGDETYRGPSAFSEPECQAIRDLAIQKNYKTHFNMHTYGGYILYPWGYIDLETPDSSAYREFAALLTSESGYAYGSGSQLLGYNSNGSIRDWMYGEQTLKGKTFGYTIEIGDDFWPTQAEIFPIAQQNLSTMLYQTHLAGAYVKFVNPGYSEQYIDPGDNINMNSIFKNIGLATAHNLDVELTSLSPYITVTAANSQFDSIEARSSATLTNPLSFSVSPSAPIDEYVSIQLTIRLSGTILSYYVISILIGTPLYVFADTTNDPLNLWTITASPTTPKWEATTTSFYSSPTSFTDSKSGNYVNNATVTMTMTNAIDLSPYTNPRLVYWTKYDIESNWDYGQVEASTNNGSSWFPLHGIYSELGTGSFQPNGEPLYDGTITNWVQEEISLEGYTSNQFKLRFELKTDGSQVRDGWYVDDIGILVYAVVPVELISFNALYLDGKVKLDWQTASELNNAGFEIEKSVFNPQSTFGEKKNWIKLGFINGKGTTTEINNYSFVDDEPCMQKTFYRLKQIDFNGTFSYSDEVEVNGNALTEFALSQNYPNPFNPETEINFSIAKPGNVTLTVYNVLGSEVAKIVNGFMEAGNHSVKFDASKLTSGVYLYTIKSGNFIATRKMILMK